jgi:hypothetical protein
MMLSITSPESSWPGERDASRRDVEVANEIPEPGLLSDFKRALLASPDALGIDRLMHMELGGRVNAFHRRDGPVLTKIGPPTEAIHIPGSGSIAFPNPPKSH